MSDMYRLVWMEGIDLDGEGNHPTLEDAIRAATAEQTIVGGNWEDLVVAFEGDQIVVHPFPSCLRNREKPIGRIVRMQSAGEGPVSGTPYAIMDGGDCIRTCLTLERAIEAARELYPGCHMETEDQSWYDEDDDGFRLFVHRKTYFGWEDMKAVGYIRIERATVNA